MNLPNESSPSSDEVKDFLQSELDHQIGARVDAQRANIVEEDQMRVNEEVIKEQLNRLVSDNIARKKFSKWIFVLTVFWMFSVLTVVILCGRGGLSLSNGVLIALITTTTANVFGFFYVVVNYLFNKSKST